MVLRFRMPEIAAAIVIFVVVLFVLSSSIIHAGTSPWSVGFETRANTNANVRNRPYVKPSSLPWNAPFPTLTTANWNATRTPGPTRPDTPPGLDRMLVIAALENEDVSWISSSFPDWQTAVYHISSSFSLLHQGRAIVDKGRIANAYLTYLIENYYNLPSIIVFLTPHRNTNRKTADQRYVSLGKYNLLKTLSISHVQNMGYTNLRCESPSICLTTILPFRTPSHEFRTLEVAMPKAWSGLFPNTPVPERLAAPCCGEFAVSRDQVRRRGFNEYKRFWEWLNKTKMDDETAGLVLEALWHVMFGRGAVDCQDVGVKGCECDVYGKC